MRIAVTIEKPEISSMLSEVFGRSNYFLIHDQEKNKEEILRNPFALELGGAGIQSARFLIENNIDIVIVNKIGINPFRFLKSVNIKIYKCEGTNAAEAINLFTDDRLMLADNIRGDITSGWKRKRYGRSFLVNDYINNKKGKI